MSSRTIGSLCAVGLVCALFLGTAVALICWALDASPLLSILAGALYAICLDILIRARVRHAYIIYGRGGKCLKLRPSLNDRELRAKVLSRGWHYQLTILSKCCILTGVGLVSYMYIGLARLASTDGVINVALAVGFLILFYPAYVVSLEIRVATSSNSIAHFTKRANNRPSSQDAGLVP